MLSILVAHIPETKGNLGVRDRIIPLIIAMLTQMYSGSKLISLHTLKIVHKLYLNEGSKKIT